MNRNNTESGNSAPVATRVGVTMNEEPIINPCKYCGKELLHCKHLFKEVRVDIVPGPLGDYDVDSLVLVATIAGDFLGVHPHDFFGCEWCGSMSKCDLKNGSCGVMS